MDTFRAILGEPAYAIADAELVRLILVIQPGHHSMRHRLAIGIAIHQNGILAAGDVQIRHLHQHILMRIQRFLRPVQQTQGAAHLRVHLLLQTQQVHARGRFAARSIIQLQQALPALQHAPLPSLHPATGESGGTLQHLAAAGGMLPL